MRRGRSMERKMEWAGRANHMGGFPRKMVVMAVGGLAKMVATFFNSTSVHNADTLIHLVRSRPLGIPLITVSNHMSTLDDPVMWGFKGFSSMDAKLARWVLAAEDVCFKNALLTYFFRLGKCIPITRGGGIYQEHMNEALERLSDGAWVYPFYPTIFTPAQYVMVPAFDIFDAKYWPEHVIVPSMDFYKPVSLHTFPEGKVSQEAAPIRRLKWGTASLIARAPVTPIVLPIIHHGFEEVMPEKFLCGRRAPFPLCNKKIKIIIGEPIEFNLPKLREMAISMSRDISFSRVGWPSTSDGLDEAAQRCLYTTISEHIQTVMENLRCLGTSFWKSKV